jgi:hypothetical protein
VANTLIPRLLENNPASTAGESTYRTPIALSSHTLEEYDVYAPTEIH